MERLEGVSRHYDWGSRTAIPEMLGLPASDRPWAELWFGAHPQGPALVGPSRAPLDRVVAADPAAALGPGAADRFGGLPFLVKILAAARPLSLQVHPDAEAARAGCAREDALGLPRSSPERSFRDDSPKPELICALTPFEALWGFRDPAQTSALLESIDTPALDPLRQRLAADPTPRGLRDLTAWLLGRDRAAAAEFNREVARACRRPPGETRIEEEWAIGPDRIGEERARPDQTGGEESASRDGRAAGEWAAARALAADLEVWHPDDPGVAVALLLNRVRLQPGEALFLGPGLLHSYLGGTGVEVMASSDNVIRAGLTAKPTDVETFLEVVSTDPVEPEVQRPSPVGGVARYRAPVAEFSLQRIETDGEVSVAGGPAILLCTRGRAQAFSGNEGNPEAESHKAESHKAENPEVGHQGTENLEIGPGEAVWVGARTESVTLRGAATIFRAGISPGP